jgi:putative transposase
VISKLTGVESAYEIPDVLWDKTVPLLPPPRRKKKKEGRPRMSDSRKAMSAIFYVLRTGCQWNALPRSLGASSTVHDRFLQEWRKRLVYSNVCGLMVYRYMIKRLGLTGNGRLWMALLQRHLLGEKGTGPNPTDRAKSGTKRSLLVDGKGVPLSVSVDGANRHDMKLTKSTLQNVVINKPEPTIKSKQHMYVWIKAMTIQKYMNYWKSMVIQFISD